MDIIKIRNEMKNDMKIVEDITRKSFYNIYIPGCIEHYLIHIMREHKDFIKELDFVLELNGEVIGNIMYTKTKLIDETGKEKNILTFGPVSISPAYQRRGYGKMLMEHSFIKAKEMGYDVIVIFGSPVMNISVEEAQKYDDTLEPMEKKFLPSQEEFYIMSRSFIE